MKELEGLEALENWVEGAIMACKDLREESSSTSFTQAWRYDGKLEALIQTQAQIEIIKLAFKNSGEQ